MGLIELIQEYWSIPQTYATWALDPKAVIYTPNAILHGLRFQATIHYNNCENGCDGRCLKNGKATADTYMQELANGRHDLHPYDDNDVHMLAFEIHNASGHGRSGVMTCTYVVGPHGETCQCYEYGYQLWLKKKADEVLQEKIKNTPIDLEDMYYEPRYD